MIKEQLITLIFGYLVAIVVGFILVATVSLTCFAGPVYLESGIDEESCHAAMMDIRAAWLNGDTQIDLYITTQGGYIIPALELMDFIAIVKGCDIKVNTIVKGYAYSAGALILQAGTVRYALPYSTLLFHNGATSMVGKSKDIKRQIEQLDIIDLWMQNIVRKRSGATTQEVKALFERDAIIGADEALKLHMIDGILWNK